MEIQLPRACRVSVQEFSQALQRAGYGFGAGLAHRCDARCDETAWTIDGQPVGLTVGRIGSTKACYLATAAAQADPLAAGDNECESNT